MTISELGKIFKIIREDFLKLTQTELGEKLKLNQSIISRLERGDGGTIETLFVFMDYMEENKLNSHAIFIEPFDKDMVPKVRTSNVEQIIELLKETQAGQEANFNKIIKYLSSL